MVLSFDHFLKIDINWYIYMEVGIYLSIQFSFIWPDHTINTYIRNLNSVSSMFSIYIEQHKYLSTQ